MIPYKNRRIAQSQLRHTEIGTIEAKIMGHFIDYSSKQRQKPVSVHNGKYMKCLICGMVADSEVFNVNSICSWCEYDLKGHRIGRVGQRRTRIKVATIRSTSDRGHKTSSVMDREA